MDIAEWLRSLNLAQYAQAFAENDIDAEVLSELREADLEKIGVSLGHRKKVAQSDYRSRSAEKQASGMRTDRTAPCRATSDRG